MDPVPTQYINRDGAALAYQVVGNGPVDIVNCMEMVFHNDLCWTDPDFHHLFERSAGSTRYAFFQRRGFGLSDRITYTPTIEQQADDVLAVMDAAGMRQATLLGSLGTCGPMALVAARAPERVHALVLLSPIPQGMESTAGVPHGWTEAELTTVIEGYRHAFANWGSGETIALWDPVLATGYNRRLMALLERSSATPAAAQAYLDWVLQTDIRDVLRSVQVPTRVLHIPSNRIPESVSRYATELLPHGTLHVLPATLPGASVGQAFVPVADHMEELATGRVHPIDANRFLGTVLFTDVVSSTELLARVGDATYRELRSAHERLVRLAVETFGGDLVNVSGDGTLSVFDGPSKAVRCAEMISGDAAEAGIEVRCGVHTGELERDGINVTGMTVHIGARVGAAADPGQVLVSRTVHDLVVGSGLSFASRGEHELKGVPGSWELFAMTNAGEKPEDLPQEESMQTPMDKVVLHTARAAPSFVRAVARLGNAIERRRTR